MDASWRLLSELDDEMIQPWGTPQWRHLLTPMFAMQVMYTGDQVTWEKVYKMFSGCKYNYDVSKC